jgi:hypothetical protein
MIRFGRTLLGPIWSGVVDSDTKAQVMGCEAAMASCRMTSPESLVANLAGCNSRPAPLIPIRMGLSDSRSASYKQEVHHATVGVKPDAERRMRVGTPVLWRPSVRAAARRRSVFCFLFGAVRGFVAGGYEQPLFFSEE